MGSQGKFMIIDGNSLIHRAFYAIRPLSTTAGEPTNAVYGFVNMLYKILADEDPACIAVAFDKGKITFRHDHFEAYKAHRKATPEDLRPQFDTVREVLRAMNIPVYECEGFEADDLIGTVTARAEEAGFESIIVTGDRDALQLVSDLTRVMITRKGISEMEVFDPAALKEKYGLEPRQVIDLKGLMGDASDNIPGVPGVGEKTAQKLVLEFGSVENLLANTDKLASKLRQKLEENRDLALLSKRLATIIRDVPCEIDLTVCHRTDPDYEALLALFRRLEFRGMAKNITDRMREQLGPADAGEPAAESRCLRVDEEKFFAGPAEVTALAYDLSVPDPVRADVAGLAISREAGEALFLAPGEYGAGVYEKLHRALSAIATHDGKKLLVTLARHGLPPRAIGFDTMVAAYLLNPAGQSQDIADLCARYLDETLLPGDDYRFTCTRAERTLRLFQALSPQLRELGMDELYYRVELPLVHVLADMEAAGVKVDRDRLQQMGEELGRKIDGLTREIFDLAGEEFNINSTKQLAVILFDKLQLPVIKKTKTGYSTDVEVLETLAAEHEIVAKILEYRQYVKLKSTYVDGLTNLINPVTGKLHTTFNQAITATGRLSSTEPNLQNIPIRLEEGRKIRKVFIPSEPDYFIVSADYSQIELRVLAHISQDEKFIEAFRNNEDIHTRTAAEVFGVPMEEVTREMRGRAKAVNFGIVYGISDFGLARNIKVSRKEAKQYIENYFDRYAGVRQYMTQIVEQAREQGYVTTVLNRRRYLPDLYSKNFAVRSFGERTAMNTPIQGSAADIIKLAMIRVYDCLKEEGLKTIMILQVHDELIFEVPGEEMAAAVKIIRECMEKAITLSVPLTVDIKKGRNWYDMEYINV
jgi:DNA polymerase-1